MFCIALDNELAEINVLRELGSFFDEKVQGYNFRPPKKYKPTKRAFWCTRKLGKMCGTVVVWITVSCPKDVSA